MFSCQYAESEKTGGSDFINRMLTKVCRKLDIIPLIKLHPQDSMALFNDRIHAESVLIAEDRDFSFGLIENARCIITTFSTFIIESVLFRIPVIQLQLEKKFDLHDFSDQTNVFAAKNEAELYSLLKNFCEGKRKLLDADKAVKYCQHFMGSEYHRNISNMTEFCIELVN